MIAVAIAGLSLGAYVEYFQLEPLRREYTRQAKDFANQQEQYRIAGNITYEQYLVQKRHNEELNRKSTWFQHAAVPPERFRLLAYHCGRVKEKYERAARSPWLPVESD